LKRIIDLLYKLTFGAIGVFGYLAKDENKTILTYEGD
jgi:hypothetical protein